MKREFQLRYVYMYNNMMYHILQIVRGGKVLWLLQINRSRKTFTVK